MAFRKEIKKDPPPTVRELVRKYGDDWYLYCATGPISSAVWQGDKRHGDYSDPWVMRRCEKGERDRVDNWDLREWP